MRDIKAAEKHLILLNDDVVKQGAVVKALEAEASAIEREARKAGESRARVDFHRTITPIFSALGLEEGVGPQAFRAAVVRACRAVDRDETVRLLRSQIEHIRNAIAQADELKIIPVKKRATQSR